MTPDQDKEFNRVLEAIEDWLLVLLAGNLDERKEAREDLIVAIDELMSALETDEELHSRLGLRGRQ